MVGVWRTAVIVLLLLLMPNNNRYTHHAKVIMRFAPSTQWNTCYHLYCYAAHKSTPASFTTLQKNYDKKKKLTSCLKSRRCYSTVTPLLLPPTATRPSRKKNKINTMTCRHSMLLATTAATAATYWDGKTWSPDNGNRVITRYIVDVTAVHGAVRP